MARQGEGDRHQTGSLIKHLVSFRNANYTTELCANFEIDCWQAWYRKDQLQISATRVLSHCVFAGGENHGWRSGCIRYLLAVYDISVVMHYYFSLVTSILQSRIPATGQIPGVVETSNCSSEAL
jgi:hypothetical protein